MASYFSTKMSYFRSTKPPSPAADAPPPPPRSPTWRSSSPPERARLAALASAWEALLARQVGAHPSLATDDLVRAVGGSAHTRDVLLLTYLRDAGGNVAAATAALGATLTWRRERRVTTVPAAAVDVPAACWPAYFLGPACEDRRPGGGGVLLYAPVGQFERRTVEAGGLPRRPLRRV
eukprot:TRINITY_DN12048_c0_g1_i1.p2 TRINITY_DN12048_c0_g1~~TRINITY_DN12048_c0_g1_i1.p2  ORF type:complete len:191 (+),score=49.97 TRINITY_DN12048_c0_g1_i1:42-575(+)